MTNYRLVDRGAFDYGALAFINRCRLHGFMVGESEGSFPIDARVAGVAAAAGLEPLAGDHDPAVLCAATPRIAIYAGAAVGYPYWAYYAHALLSIGLGFDALTGVEIVSGALSGYDLLVMPGGFATWGLDRAEGMEGIDAAIAGFIRRGGSYIGSCGGAFYVSDGRPGWLGAIDAMPKFTQEYLLTGAAILGVSLGDGAIGRGLPEIVELPYYHGPVYVDAPRSATALGHFCNFISESRLFIKNPLSPALFEQEMKDGPAIFTTSFGEGKVLAFSPHPEMGEFVRKGIALDGYIRRFAPIRGFKVMDETLRFFMKDDCAGFRLIHNAIASLDLFGKDVDGQDSHRTVTSSGGLIEILDVIDDALAAMFTQLDDLAGAETERMRDIAEAEIERLRQEWRNVTDRLRQACLQGPVEDGLRSGLSVALQASARTPVNDFRLAETLVMTELPIRLMAAALRVIGYDRLLETAQ